MYFLIRPTEKSLESVAAKLNKMLSNVNRFKFIYTIRYILNKKPTVLYKSSTCMDHLNAHIMLLDIKTK